MWPSDHATNTVTPATSAALVPITPSHKSALDRQIGEAEYAVERVAELPANGPGAPAFQPRLPLVGHESSPKPEPEQQRDQVGVDFLQFQQPVAHLSRASEDIDAAARQVLEHESPVQAPEPFRCEPGEPPVGATRPMPEHDIRFPARQQFVELEHEIGWLLQIGREHSEALALAVEKAGGDG